MYPRVMASTLHAGGRLTRVRPSADETPAHTEAWFWASRTSFFRDEEAKGVCSIVAENSLPQRADGCDYQRIALEVGAPLLR